MNSLYIMSKQSKVVDALVRSSCCCCLDLKAEGKKWVEKNYLRPHRTAWIHFCMMHLFRVFVLLLTGTQLSSHSEEPFVPSLSLCNKCVVFAEWMKRSLACSPAEKRNPGGGVSTASPQ